MIPYGRQDISQEDIEAVVEVLRSEWLTQGPMVPRFEQAVAEKVGARHAVAMNSATSALHVACLALGLGPGDLLWTVPNTFVASANCGRYCGAEVDFVDIEPDTSNIDIAALREKLLAARHSGQLPKILVPVDFAGQPVDQGEIKKLSDEFGFRVIEDASHAIGASRNGEPVGSCRWCDITIFSFHPVKVITSGEGGMALTNNPEWAARMVSLRSHGITRDPSRMVSEPDGPWYYEQTELGYNYRMTDIHAALGLSQLGRLETFVESRNSAARRYSEMLASLPIRLPAVRPGSYSAFHLYTVRLQENRVRRSHREVFEFLRESGIGVSLHYIPVHLQPYYRALGFGPGDFPEAEEHYREAITLPLFYGMTDEQQLAVVAALRRALQ